MDERKRTGLRARVYEKLLDASEERYQEFHRKLLPGVTGILGARKPNLRRYAGGL